jgi:MFS transporter, ACS family, glucarate transporter
MAEHMSYSNPPDAGKPDKATHARNWVIVFAVTLSVLAYIDRVCISMVAPDISRDLHLNHEAMGAIFGTFALAYAIFEIPSGWMGDWMGPRRVLIRIVLWWSFFTAATGWMWSQTSMMVTRFLFGAGEAGCFPNITKAFTVWLPHDEQVRAQGIMWLCARWGGAFTPLLVIWVLSWPGVTWRLAFGIFGLLGTVWAVFFYRWFRDHPREHPSVNAAEMELLKGGDELASGHGDVPWRKLIGSGTVWLLWVQFFGINYPWYFYITWLPTYLQENRHLSLAETANYAILPLFFGGLGSLVCGFVQEPLGRLLNSVALSRKAMAFGGMVLASGFVAAVVHIQDPLYAMLSLGMASFCNDLVMPGAWATCMDIGGKYAGTLSGSMNMMGNLAGFIAPTVGGYILVRTGGDWSLVLYIMAAMYFICSFSWLALDPVTPLKGFDAG